MSQSSSFGSGRASSGRRSQPSSSPSISNTNVEDVFALDEEFVMGFADLTTSPAAEASSLSNVTPQVADTGKVSQLDEIPNTKAPVWEQGESMNSFHNYVFDTEAGLTVAYRGALETVRSMNPEYFQMPWGSYVVSVKTDEPMNVVWAIRNGSWVFVAKIAHRLMKLWNTPRHPQAGIFFLVSVNHTKRFCALGEMRGEWNEKAYTEGWHSVVPDNLGAVPVTWRFVKNVGYEEFEDLHHANGQPIVNVWNGMTFSIPLGRVVAERYIRAPHESNILAKPLVQTPGGVPRGRSIASMRRARHMTPTPHDSRPPSRTKMSGRHLPASTSLTSMTSRISERNKVSAEKKLLMERNWRSGSGLKQTVIDGTEDKIEAKASKPGGLSGKLNALSFNPSFVLELANGGGEQVGLRPGDIVTFVCHHTGVLVPIATNFGPGSSDDESTASGSPETLEVVLKSTTKPQMRQSSTPERRISNENTTIPHTPMGQVRITPKATLTFSETEQSLQNLRPLPFPATPGGLRAASGQCSVPQSPQKPNFVHGARFYEGEESTSDSEQ